MATLDEVTRAAGVLRDAGCAELTLLHCTSAYPTPVDQCNLAAIETMRQATGTRVGWSDHSVSPAVIYRAVHRWGAEMIEFHLDLDGAGAEYGGGHCWLPDQIAQVIENIRAGFTADGSGEKRPVEAELSDRAWRADPADGLRPNRDLRDR
jgi:N-acetylneuraminate synthase